MFRYKFDIRMERNSLVQSWRRLFKERRKRDKSEFEHCIICHKTTPTRKDTPIEKRVCYVIGAGQLCFYCYKDVYR